ncbi:MAG TPA: nitroreductase family deazaflavin-dependent oxidoreductase [Ktedonobacterales bacterium]|jgi:deazaflavin-dependent oxidoreductase (nitroreductase family)
MTPTQTFRMTRSMRLGTALLKTLLQAGIPLGPLVLLSVRGRRSGTLYTTPVALVQHGHERWLVAAFGEVNWVRNLRAAGAAYLTNGRRTEPISVVELGDTDAAPILQRFLQHFHRVPFIRPYFGATLHSPLADFEREAVHHPVFGIVCTNEKTNGSKPWA